MRADHPIPPPANDDPASPPAAPPLSDLYKLIIGRCISFAMCTILGLIMVVFLAIPAGTPLEDGLDLGSSLWSLNISTSHSKLITIEYTHIMFMVSFNDQLETSSPSLMSTFPQGPGCVMSLRAKAQSRMAIITHLGVSSPVRALNGGEVTIDVVLKIKWRMRLGPWWVAVFNVDISCTGLTFTAPTGDEGSGIWMILGGTLSCSVDIIPV
ncbi:hypothetical protein ACJRO7_009651 [Eucalyptus globulus]|uniref:Late embryogenesis abundant protein LEA-2 subgroup domain-containing protein n=1 Tax=Eucalyptus globulus TaxID=34317 RepID=A0ABD3L9E1_EUCGL